MLYNYFTILLTLRRTLSSIWMKFDSLYHRILSAKFGWYWQRGSGEGDYQFCYYLPLEKELTVRVISQQEMLTPPMHLISPLVYPGVRACLTLIFVLLFWITRLMTVCYHCLFINKTLYSGKKIITYMPPFRWIQERQGTIQRLWGPS